jgi:nucleotide-binding universal stress UspA family protein
LQLERLQTLIESLEPVAIRPLIQPIVRIANDVARETVQVADREGADLILMGWHRPAFSTNRLGGRVGQILSMAKTDVAVYINRQERRLERILVPYVAGIHSDLGLELALRILVNQPSAVLTVLRVTVPGQLVGELSNEFRVVMKQLPRAVRDRISLEVIESSDPLQAVITASADVDLTIAGASREWGIERQTLGQYTDALACECRSPVLITRRYSQVTSHMAALLVENAEETDKDPSETLA